MGNLGEEKPVSKLVIEFGGNNCVFSGGGGVEPGVPLPENTVDSRSIMDDAVQMEDLNQNVKDKMVTDDDRVTAEELANFNV